MATGNLNIYKKSEKQIIELLKQKKFEDTKLIEFIESYLIKKRGFVFKLPKPNSPAIILATGGLDSVIASFLLMKYFHLKLYPLFINWGQKNLKQEKRAFNFFVKYFSQKYPDLYQKPQIINSHIPAKEIFKTRDDVVILRNTNFAIHGVEYANYLERTKNIKTKHIFINTVASDGVMCPDTTLTAIRSTNLNICANEGNFSWQVSSLAIEKELGFYFDKKDLIPLVNESDIPLEKTWSCYQSGNIQCGECFTCWGRKLGFEAANIPDKTIYFNKTKTYSIIKKTKKIPLKIKRLLSGAKNDN
jgi:7-cyano-7-deazaguanine synthase